MSVYSEFGPYWDGNVRRLIAQILAEDMPFGDTTTRSLDLGASTNCAIQIIAREDCVLAGVALAVQVFRFLGVPDVTRYVHNSDGERIYAGSRVLEYSSGGSDYRPLLTGERAALNLLQRMSGIATLTSQYVEAVDGTKAKIADTRKTAPLLRNLDKYAVTVGGGVNHRFNLSDGVLIKDNHIKLGEMQNLSLSELIQRSKANAPHTCKIEVEVTSKAMAMDALGSGADIIMLDNMSVDEMRETCAEIDGRAIVEASGGITLENVRAVAEVGVDIISIGALTHSAPAIDFTMEFS